VEAAVVPKQEKSQVNSQEHIEKIINFNSEVTKREGEHWFGGHMKKRLENTGFLAS